MTIQEKLYTIDEFWEIAHLPENDGKRLELVEGVIVEMPPAGGEHGELGGNLFGFVWTHVRQQKLGHMTAAETGYILFKNDTGKDTVRAPDIGFISYQRMPDRLPSTYVPLPPDLAIEIVSPNDRSDEIEKKVTDYLRAGVRLFVFVYSVPQSVYVYQKGEVARLRWDDVIDFSAVLPDFSLRISDIF